MRARDRCAWVRCRTSETSLTYLGKPLCRKHWEEFCRIMDERGREAAIVKIGLTPEGFRRRNDRGGRRLDESQRNHLAK